MALNLLRGTLRRGAYSAAQFAKVGWYTAQYVGARHIAGPVTSPGEVPKPFRSSSAPSSTIYSSFMDLFREEATAIAEGTYKMPKEFRQPASPLHLVKQAKTYFDEARAVARRSKAKGGATQVRDMADGAYPTYYLQNFHFQTDGWLSDRSAEVYDTQVEALFTGAAGAMRRQALPLLLKEIRHHHDHGHTPVMADIGCGTGRLLVDVMDNEIGVDAHAIDLSPAYLKAAEKDLKSHTNVQFIQAAAETLPYEDNCLDIVFSVYLFHELPPKVRREVAAEVARVLKPGGLYVHVDSIQYGDTDMDLLLEAFPRAFHEPYYDSYCQEDLGDLFSQAGLSLETEKIGFLTKMSALRAA